MADVAVLMSEADAAYNSGTWDVALEAYKKALEADSSSAVACRRMADVLAIRGRFAEVLEAYFRLIDILESQEDLDGALEVAQWVMNLKPDSDQARMKMIFAYHKKGDLKEVVRQSRELARLYIDLGQGDQSIALLQQAQKADPENLDIGLELAEMYVSHGHIQDGANQYRKVANAFLEQNNTEKAAEAFRRMKVIVPDDPAVLLTLGNLYVDLKRYNEAEQEYRSILRHNLNHEEALLALGRVCQLKKQFRDAILAFNRILSINPDEVTAKEKLGELYQAQGLTSESIKNYLSAAQSYLEFDERDKAIRLFQIVLGLDPANPTACRELTNLGAPLVGIRNEELEPPPEPAPVEAKSEVSEDASGDKGSRAGLSRRADDDSKVRSGLLRPSESAPASKLGSKSGLLSSKPKLGEGKPSLGGSGGPRKGLLRPGLSSSGGDKPMLLRRGQEAAELEAAEEASVEMPSGEAQAPPATRQAPRPGMVSAVVAESAPTYSAPADDPFPGAVDPFAASQARDPFGDSASAFANSESPSPFGAVAGNFGDPFGGSEAFGSGDDPFATASSGDPFASAGDPFSTTATAGDPFATSGASGDPFTNADPFSAPSAGDPFSNASDPFAPASSQSAAFAPAGDPFAHNDPFSPSQGGADPFASSGGDPFSSGADPFSVPSGAPDPFAVSADPFAATASADPFAAGTDPFATTSGGEDPFAGSGDPFAASSPTAGDPFAPVDPFATSAAQVTTDPFAGSHDPFAAQPAVAADPFQSPADPFGGGGDPFAEATHPGVGADLFSSPASSADPYSGGAEIFASAPAASDPFAQPANDPFGAAPHQQPSDPFASADPYGGSSDLFSTSPSGVDPYGAGSSDIFSTAPSGGDPYGGAAQADPFGAPAAAEKYAPPVAAHDPFAGGGDFAADPFAAPTNAPDYGGDPFGAAPVQQYGGGSESSGDLFAAPAAEPYGTAGDPFAAPSDPFAAASPVNDPFASHSDPFAVAPPTSDPFGVHADPFASAPASEPHSPMSDPFGAAPVSSDPFAAPNDPFSPAPDPFGGTSVADPFAAAPAIEHFPTHSTGHDPFGAGPAADPFAAPPVSDHFSAPPASVPFASSAVVSDPFAAPTADPFSTPVVGDPFAVSAPAADPFAEPDSYGNPAAAPYSLTVAPLDPFASTPTDPFASAPAIADPFSAPPPALSLGPVADPYAAPVASSDPFAGASTAVDLFSAQPVAEPPLSFGRTEPAADLFSAAPADPVAPAWGTDITPASSRETEAAHDPFAGAAEPPVLSLGTHSAFARGGEAAPSFGGTFPSAGPVSAEPYEPPHPEANPYDPFATVADVGLTPPSLSLRSESPSDTRDFGAVLELPGSPRSAFSAFDSGERPAAPEPAPTLDLLIPVASAEQQSPGPSAWQTEPETAELTPLVTFAPEPQPEPEPEPIPEPVPESPPPAPAARARASLSLEDESSPAHVQQAQRLRETHKDADVATLIRAYRKSIEDSPENLLLRAELADLHLRFGLLEDAVVQYRQILKRNPQSLGLHHRLIQAHLWNDNHEDAAATLMELSHLHVERGEQLEALEALQSILSLDPHHFQARRAMVDRFTALGDAKLGAHHLRQLAESALTKGNVEEAIPAFKQLMEISDDPSFEERLAQVYETQGDKQLALHHFGRLAERYTSQNLLAEAASVSERIVALAPEDLAQRTALVELYSKLGMTDKVLTQRYELARFYHSRGIADQALSLLEQVLAERSDHHEARRFLVDTYLETSNLEEAIKHTVALTEHYIQEQDHGNAISLYRKLIDVQPGNSELRHNIIKFYEMAQDSENAAEQWLFLAQLHSRESNWDEAISAYQKLLELDENRVEIHYQMALIYLDRLSNATEAMKRFHRVYELNPGHTEAMSKYIRMLLRIGKSESAAKVLQQLEQANPDGATVRKNVLTDFRTRIESEPSDLKARFVYGELCYHLGELDLAIEQFQQTRRDSSFELRSYNMLGLCFAEKTGFNMLDLAIKQFRRGLETSGHSEQEYLELRYNLAMLQYRNNRLQEALQELKDCYAVDIAYRDVREWVRRIEAEIAGGPKVARLFPREK